MCVFNASTLRTSLTILLYYLVIKLRSKRMRSRLSTYEYLHYNTIWKIDILYNMSKLIIRPTECMISYISIWYVLRTNVKRPLPRTSKTHTNAKLLLLLLYYIVIIIQYIVTSVKRFAPPVTYLEGKLQSTSRYSDAWSTSWSRLPS